jgi:hypothetical protein
MAKSADLPGYQKIIKRLVAEFAGVHSMRTVSRCVAAAQYGALDVTGTAPTDLVERIARRHLEVLALVAAERRN